MCLGFITELNQAYPYLGLSWVHGEYTRIDLRISMLSNNLLYLNTLQEGNRAIMQKSKSKELMGEFGKGCATNCKSTLDKLIKNNFGGCSFMDQVNHVIHCLSYCCMCHMCDVGLYSLLNDSFILILTSIIYDLNDGQLNCL